jgi:hypothetical protein
MQCFLTVFGIYLPSAGPTSRCYNCRIYDRYLIANETFRFQTGSNSVSRYIPTGEYSEETCRARARFEVSCSIAQKMQAWSYYSLQILNRHTILRIHFQSVVCENGNCECL